MTAAPLLPNIDALAHRTVAQPLDLVQFFEPGVNLCVWERTPAPALAAWLQRVVRMQPVTVSLRLSVDVLDLVPLVRAVPEAPERALWAEEMRGLVELFVDLFEPANVGVRLVTLSTPMCPRFHVDQVGARMVCTYAGAGTEWLPNALAPRQLLGRAASGQGAVEAAVGGVPGAVQQLSPFDVGLLKGERWQGNEGNGLVHRSPAAEARAGRRLLLTLDTLDE